MAVGQIKWFAEGLTQLGNKVHNLSSDTLMLGIVTNATVPAVNTAIPHWGGTGTTNFATNQVATGGTSYTGPKTLTSVSWSNVSGVATLSASSVALAQDAAGFTNGAYGIIFNNTDANKRAIAYVELSSGGTLSLASGAQTIDWNGGTDDKILTLTQS
jgi:hypothetical protein